MILALAFACSGPTDDESGHTGTPPDEPTLSRVYDEVLSSCALSSCHAPGSAIGDNGLEFSDPASAHAAMVEVEATGAPGEVFVVPGDPDASYVVKKVEGDPDIEGGPMPSPAGGLQPEQVQLLRDWIAAGALDN